MICGVVNDPGTGGQSQRNKWSTCAVQMVNLPRNIQCMRAGDDWQAWHNEAEHKKALVFTNEDGRYLVAKRLYLHFKKLTEEAGAPDARVHDLRHTFAVISLQNGDDVKTVQTNLGHASASFTLDVYGHVSDRMQRESAGCMQQNINEISRTKNA